MRFTSGIICGSGSFAVQFGDHLRSGDHLRRCTEEVKKKKKHLGLGKRLALFQEWSGVEFGKMKTQTERATSKAENPQAANPAALDSAKPSLQQAKNSYDG